MAKVRFVTCKEHKWFGTADMDACALHLGRLSHILPDPFVYKEIGK
jgi:hypothetical protein